MHAGYYGQLSQWSSLKWTPVGWSVTIMTSVENHKKYVGCQSLKFIITTSIIYCCYSPNEHKYISNVMILSGWKHFSIRSSHTMSRVDQFIIATNGNIQMKNISCLSHFPIKWCLCLPNIFWKLSSRKTWSNNWWIMHETRGQWAEVNNWAEDFWPDQMRGFAWFAANKVLTWRVTRPVAAWGTGKL